MIVKLGKWSLARLTTGCLIICWLVSASGCADVQSRIANAEQIAQLAKLNRQVVDGGSFQFLVYTRLQQADAPVRIYIEGDGFAWVTRTQRSMDPTPYNPIALKLAAADHYANVIYLARPCQFMGVGTNERCRADIWSSERFSEEVIASTSSAIDKLVPIGHKVELIGYSGGAAVALLVAARRSDVITLRSVAGNLDSDAFTTIHDLTPLTGSLNPKTVAGTLARIPQRHFIGSRDEVITVEIVRSYLQGMDRRHCTSYEVIEGANHSAGWAALWSELVRQQPVCAEQSVTEAKTAP